MYRFLAWQLVVSCCIGIAWNFKCPSKCKCTFTNESMYSVSCSHLGLKQFPAEDLSVSRLADISELRLQGNAITEIKQSDLQGLLNLKLLDLSRNKIKKVPGNMFAGFKKLTSLHLSANHITSIDDNAFNGVPSLKNLLLDKNQIKTLSQHAFSGLYFLEMLDLSENNLTEIHAESFSSLLSLKKLFLRENNLPSIPPKLFNSLVNVRVLDFQKNNLTDLPRPLFSGLQSLQELYVSDNKLTVFNKKHLSGLKQLRILHIRNNLLRKLSLTETLKLYELDASGNRISRIAFLENPEHLKIIRLASNKIKKIPKDFFKPFYTYRLEEIDLSDNELETIEASFYFVLVYRINLSKNKLRTFKSDLDTGIRSLNISHNLIEQLPVPILKVSSFYFTESQRTFDFSHNNITSLNESTFKNLRSIRTLNLTENFLESIGAELTEITNLQVLDLSKNRISTVNKDAFKNAANLKTLDLSKNRLSDINDMVETSKLGKLERLDLSSNLLGETFNASFRLLNLKMLDLSQNKLKKFKATSLNSLINLEYLSLASNQIRTLPIGFFTTNTKIKKLSLVNNTNLKCGCRLIVALNIKKSPFKVEGECSNSRKNVSSLVQPVENLWSYKCNLCPVSPCNYKGKCSPNKRFGYLCTCKKGFLGKNCEKSLDCHKTQTCGVCKATSCKNEGICLEVNMTSYLCKCKNGFAGDVCQIKASTKEPTVTCTPSACKNNGVCQVVNNKEIKCKCVKGYIGKFCETNPELLCKKNKCRNNGECILDSHDKKGFRCLCTSITTGEFCEIKEGRSPCENNLCANNASCISLQSSYYCACSNKFTGRYCTEKLSLSGTIKTESKTSSDLGAIAAICLAVVLVIVLAFLFWGCLTSRVSFKGRSSKYQSHVNKEVTSVQNPTFEK